MAAKIDSPGIYEMTLEKYHTDCCIGPSISSSGIRAINRNPRRYWWDSYLNMEREERVPTKSMLLGTAAHTLLLGEKGFAQRYVLQPTMLSGYKWNANRTEHKAWLAAREKEGMIIIRQDDLDTIKYMRDSLGDHELVRSGLINGDIEKSIIWKDELTDIWLKSRPDAIPSSSNIVVDLKTCAETGLRPAQSSIERYGYDTQLAMVGMGMEAVLGRTIEHYVIAWVATAPPYDVMVTELSAKHIHFGHRKVLRGTALLKKCLEEEQFHGDFDDNTVIEPTGYYMHVHEEMDTRGELPPIAIRKENPKK